jgi:hypothetical protein
MVEEVNYSNTWPKTSGSSMEIHDPNKDNSVSDSRYESTPN